MSRSAKLVIRGFRRGASFVGVLVGSLAVAQGQTADEIVKALTPAQARSISVIGSDGGQQAFVETLRNRTAFSASERERIAAASADRPSIGLEIPFEYNSVVIGPKALPLVKSLGVALA